MVKFLGNWIEGIAIAVIIASIFEMILPNGNLKKYIKVVLGIYIVFNIISPFVDSNALYSFNISDTIDEYTNNVTSSSTSVGGSSSTNVDIEKIYLDTLESEIIETVESQGYTVNSCNVDAVFDTSKNAGIKKINIVIAEFYSDNIEESSNDNTDDDTEIEEVEEIEKVEINIGEKSNISSTSQKRVTQSNIIQLKKYLSEHYEIDRSIINIQTK